MATLNEYYYLSWASVMMLFETCLFDIMVSFWVCVHKDSHGRRKSCEVKSMSTHNFPLTEPWVSVCLCCGWVKPVNWAWYFCPWCRSEWECESFFFSLQAASVCLTPRGHQSDESEWARGPHGESKRNVWGLRREGAERVLFSSRCTAIRNYLNAALPHIQRRICISANRIR